MLRGRMLVVVVLVAGFVGVGAGSAAAATIKVTTTFDDQTQGDGQCSLRKAILDVNSPGSSQIDCAPAAFGANTIMLPAGNYQLGGGLSSPGSLTIAPIVTNLTIAGASQSSTTIDAGPLNDRAFVVSGGAGVTMTNFTIVNSTAQSGAAGAPGAAGQPGAGGGAILNQGTLTLTNAAITNSHAGSGGNGGNGSTSTGGGGAAGGSGGAIYNSGALTLNGATLASNTAGSGGSGGLGASGDAGSIGGPGGDGGTGGAIENAAGSLTVTGSTIRGNTAGNGGVGGNGGQGTKTTGGNGGSAAAGANGGGIWSDGGSLTITNSTFASNSGGAGGTGGNGGPATATSGTSTTGGTGGAGGNGGNAGGIGAASPSSASILQATAAGNNAGTGGTGGTGGIGSPSGNAGAAGLGGVGGGVLAQGAAITVRNSLLALSGGGNCSGLVQDGGFNLSFGDLSCPPTFSGGDPNLGPLQNNGGPAATISLQPGSAAIDQIPSAGSNCPATDERGAPRPSGSSSSKCDIGAYEVVPPVGVTQPATNIGLSAATVVASVTPYAGQASVVFQYGTTTKYGKATGIQRPGGVTATPITANVSGLKPNTTYHYRVVVLAMDGTATGKDVTFTTSVTPAITGLKIKPKSFSPARGTTISYQDTRVATTTVAAFRCAQIKRGRCVRFVKLASFTRKDVAGANKVMIKRRFGSRALRTGRYRLQLTPRSNGKAGKTVTATFSVT